MGIPSCHPAGTPTPGPTGVDHRPGPCVNGAAGVPDGGAEGCNQAGLGHRGLSGGQTSTGLALISRSAALQRQICVVCLSVVCPCVI